MNGEHDSSGEVHAHISSDPGAADRSESRSRDRAGELLESARRRADDLRTSAGEATDRARQRAAGYLDDAEEAINDRTGAVSAARQHPLAAVGIAFALGFALAGHGDEDEVRHPALSRAKQQIKGAIVGGISAAISQQLRTFIEEQGGIGSLLAAVGVDLPGGSRHDDDAYDIA